MAIKIDQKSKDSTYIETGSLTIYIEHSPNCAEDYISVWDRNKNADEDRYIFHTNYDFQDNNRYIKLNGKEQT
tara:strand:- start:1417 stop:1635 length:219 start_codon:yes stop_codon:yes gene_type:complete